MKKIYQYIAESIAAKTIDKDVAVNLLKMLKKEEIKDVGDIAIIGVSVQLPSANNVWEYWSNIENGIDCIEEFPQYRKEDIEKFALLLQNDKEDEEFKFLKGAFLKEIDKFDYKFFKLTPKQASLMDPIQRIMLETMWNVIEDSGYSGRIKGSNTGVYVGYASNPVESYANAVFQVEPDSMQVAMTGNIACIIPSRISYALDLKGPSILIDTACSASLVSVHLACKGIKNGDCDMAIAGGIKLHMYPFDNKDSRIGIESSDGKTKTFDESSDGTGIGEGASAILLKPLTKALKDGDNIYAIIKGSAINQDGTSAGITAPNPIAQTEVIIKAWEDAKINPETISYFEAHGTGTKIGDPLEVEGITKAFKKYTDKKQFCAIGTVKTNIGHLYEGSGMAGLIKLALSLKAKKMPASLHFNKPNKKISFEDSPVYINNKLTDWESLDGPRRCGISAFGFSGTNCHIVLEEGPEIKNNLNNEKARILTLSAKSEASLSKLIENYIEFFDSEEKLSIRDLCYTSNTGRGHYEHRLAVVAGDINEIKVKLKKISGIKFKEIIDSNVYYGEHKVVVAKKDTDDISISEDEKLELSDKVLNKIIQYTEEEIGIEDICSLYVKGADVDWLKLYQNENPLKISMPGYPFERNRCWLELPELEHKSKVEPDEKEDRLHYQMCWIEEKIDNQKSEFQYGTLLILKDDTGLGDEIIHKLRSRGRSIIEISIGDSYEKINNESYIIRDSEDDYNTIVKEMTNIEITQILHLSSIIRNFESEDVEIIEKRQTKGVYSLFYLIKSMALYGKTSNVDILLIAEYANEVNGEEERIIPESATIFGLGKVVGRENNHIICRALDVDMYTNSDDIISELNTEFKIYQSAYRKGKRYVEEFKALELENKEEEKIEIKNNGVYIITGGLGGIGLAVAKFLASKTNVKLALINRSKFPEKEMWEEILNKNEDNSTCDRIRSLKEIENMGSEIFCYSGDVSKLSEMQDIIMTIKEKLGMINGVIHGAGVPGDNLIAFKSKEEFKKVYLPKVQGTRILDILTEQDNMDFFIMFSSVATVFSLSGQSDYAAANIFMDSYSSLRNKKGKKTLAIDWVAWKETGMAVKTNANVDFLFKAISTEDAISAMESVINKKVNRVLIGALNYKNNIVTMIEKSKHIKISDKILATINKYHKATTKSNKKQNITVGFVNLKGRDEEKYSDNEKKIAQIWGSVFGYSELGVTDNFFELGGDSILAVKIVNQINSTMNLNIGITDILNYLNIEELASFIDGKSDEPQNTEMDLQKISKEKEQDYYLVSSAQRRMLLMNEIDDVATSYNLPEIRILQYKLDYEMLKNAAKTMIDRHESFRTSFEFHEGQFFQIINKDVNFEIEFIELDGSLEENYDINKLSREFIKPFNLKEVPLLRIRLITLKPEYHIFMIDVHHIISDAVSRRIFINEFMMLCNGEKLNEQLLQYKDYSSWQNEKLLNGGFLKQEKFWLDQLSGEIPLLNLPLDYKRPELKSIKGNHIRVHLENELANNINKLCFKTESTLYMILFAAYNVLLFRYTNQEDILVGTPVTGRVNEDMENIVGLFVNTLVIRSNPSEEITFSEFLSTTKGKTLEALENQEYPFEELLDRLNIPRNTGRNPLFDTMFVLQNIVVSYDKVDPICDFENNTSKFDLLMEVVAGKEYFYFTIEYCEDLFKKDTIERMCDDYIKILAQIVDNLDIMIGKIELSKSFSKAESTNLEDIIFDF